MLEHCFSLSPSWYQLSLCSRRREKELTPLSFSIDPPAPGPGELSQDTIPASFALRFDFASSGSRREDFKNLKARQLIA